jgi:hypothetical protein
VARKAPAAGQGVRFVSAAMIVTGLGLLSAGAFVATRGPDIPDIPPVIVLLSGGALVVPAPTLAVIATGGSDPVTTVATLPDGAERAEAPRAPAPDRRPAMPPLPPEPPPGDPAAEEPGVSVPDPSPAEAVALPEAPPSVAILIARPQGGAPATHAAPPPVMRPPDGAASGVAPLSSLAPDMSRAVADNAPPRAIPPPAAPRAAPRPDHSSQATEERVAADDAAPVVPPPVVLSPETGAPGSVPALPRPTDLGRAPPAAAPAADARLVAAASAAFDADPPRQLLRVGVFGVEANAIRIAERLRLEGIAVRVGPIARGDGQVWQVLAGPAADRADALRLLRLVAALGIADAYFVGP